MRQRICRPFLPPRWLRRAVRSGSRHLPGPPSSHPCSRRRRPQLEREDWSCPADTLDMLETRGGGRGQDALRPVLAEISQESRESDSVRPMFADGGLGAPVKRHRTAPVRGTRPDGQSRPSEPGWRAGRERRRSDTRQSGSSRSCVRPKSRSRRERRSPSSAGRPGQASKRTTAGDRSTAGGESSGPSV